MGSGKTYSGALLATLLGSPFADLDDQIVQNAGISISKIFEKHGEDYFRELESNVLRQTTHFQPSVISCGGGAPCFFDNMEWMNANGITVYLKTAPQLLAFRLRIEMQSRPLLNNYTESQLMDFIELRLEERELFYAQANIIFNQTHLDQKVAEELFLMMNID
jgi:shikimate kinase